MFNTHTLNDFLTVCFLCSIIVMAKMPEYCNKVDVTMCDGKLLNCLWH